MLKRLTQLLAQLRSATVNGQIGLVPGSTGGLAIIVSWAVNNEQHEVAQAFTPEEAEAATDEDILAALQVLVAAVWMQVAESRGENLTQEQALTRIKLAARHAPQHLVTNTLAEALRGKQNG